jgi:hypothetical protein
MPISAALTIMNAVVLAMPYYGMSHTYKQTLDGINLALTIAFTVELLVRLVGHGTTDFLKDRFNLFDAVRDPCFLVSILLHLQQGVRMCVCVRCVCVCVCVCVCACVALAVSVTVSVTGT